MSVLPDPLPLQDTTPITEAVENSFDEATRSLRDISHQLQSAISIAASKRAGAFDEFVAQSSRLGLALVRGYVSAFSTAVDGLAMIGTDVADWWWSGELKPPFPNNAPKYGVLRASVVTTIPDGETIVPPQWVRVARRTSTGQFSLIDRGVGVLPGWDGTCYVSLRQFDDYKPCAARITFRLVDAAGHTVASTIQNPITAVFSM